MGENVTERAAALAAELLKAALAAQSAQERADAAKLSRMMHDPPGKAFTVQMVDQVFRSGHASRSPRGVSMSAARWDK